VLQQVAKHQRVTQQRCVLLAQRRVEAAHAHHARRG
jgi:hypothetical protein